MANFLKDALALVDDKLSAIFHTQPVDHTKERRPLIRGIEKAQKQFSEGNSKAPRRWWKVSNDVVEFSANVNGNIIQLDAKDKLYIAVSRFPEFLAAFKSAVEAGEFDKEIANHGKGSVSVEVPAGATGKGWSQERKAKFRATMAARKTAKG
jgi:hypothetical protein